MLASSDLVRVSTTRSAQLALGLIGVHALTQGAAAARLIDALPWTVTLVPTATDPVRALLLGGGTAAAAMAIALAQLLRQLPTQPEGPSPVAPAVELGLPQGVPDLEAESSRTLPSSLARLPWRSNDTDQLSDPHTGHRACGLGSSRGRDRPGRRHATDPAHPAGATGAQ
jgi:hypothetical protein